MQQDYFTQLLIEDLLSAPLKFNKNTKKTKKLNKSEPIIENKNKQKEEIIDGGRFAKFTHFSFWNKLVNTIIRFFQH
jgi:hypothetical protein